MVVEAFEISLLLNSLRATNDPPVLREYEDIPKSNDGSLGFFLFLHFRCRTFIKQLLNV